MKYFSLKFFSSLTLIASICACVDRNVAGGISEETEGVVAITNKTIAGVSQKGPFAKGSNVYLKETKADGSLAPTGKEFYATIRNDAGEFKIENINLESQYALLTVEGYYTRESTNGFSDCTISLNAATDLSKRNSTNINLLTHFEYQRILNLIESGATFANAKAQAEKEIFTAFGYEKSDCTAEDLDITGKSEEDRILHEISVMVDKAIHISFNNATCQEVKSRIESITNDFATDGILSDSLTAAIVGFSYQTETSNALQILKQYAGLGACTPTEAGNTYKTQKTIFLTEPYIPRPPATSPTEIIHSFDYAICTGTSWSLLTKEEYDDATAIIQHQTGTMTDPRDGKTYKTTSFTTNGKKYEWMTENLQYAGGKYTWTEAMAIDDSLVTKSNASSILKGDSIHQGICPENWHIPGSWEWKDLLDYVGSPNKLYSKNWNKTYFAGAYFEDNIDFNAEPSFFEPHTNCNIYNNPYANFIAYSLDQSIHSTTTPYQYYFIDNNYNHTIDSNGNLYIEPRGALNFVYAFFGTNPDGRNPYPNYNIKPYPYFMFIESSEKNFEVNVRCVKN